MYPILYQDPSLVVIDKPSGVPVSAPRAGGGNVEAETGLLLVHRLDAETSGALALARTAEAQRRLNAAFQGRDVQKVYRAVCVGRAGAAEGLIDVPLGDWKRGRVIIGRGRSAQTRWRVVWEAGGRVGIEAEPLTGRTHQIRAHLCEIGLPILGDDAYGAPCSSRVWLHALRLGLPWPHVTDRLVVDAPLPDGFNLG